DGRGSGAGLGDRRGEGAGHLLLDLPERYGSRSMQDMHGQRARPLDDLCGRGTAGHSGNRTDAELSWTAPCPARANLADRWYRAGGLEGVRVASKAAVRGSEGDHPCDEPESRG